MATRMEKANGDKGPAIAKASNMSKMLAQRSGFQVPEAASAKIATDCSFSVELHHHDQKPLA